MRSVQFVFAIFILACVSGFAADAPRPNIVLIMSDDMGYSDIGCYGGEIETPNLDRLAAEGMRFTQFYNNAKCAPTRASLLTGLYSQQAGVYNGPAKMQHSVTLAEVLREAGYRTLMVGKWHADELPVQRGFDRYYGLADGCCNFFNPGNPRAGEPAPVHKNFPRRWAIDNKIYKPFTPEDPNFYTTDAFTDNALGYLDTYAGEDKPFFLYVAYTAPHYPLHAHPEDIAKYRGKYKIGWDELRRQRYARMVDAGLIREEWGLSERDPKVPAWDAIASEAERDEWDHLMAVYAAMVDRMDQNIGRILDKIKAMGEADNTIVMFLSDNGGCAEHMKMSLEQPPGAVDSYRSVDPPWANAQNTPFRKYKRYDYEGGVSTPLVVHWPGHVKAGTVVHEVGHIIDVMPTILELSGGDYPGENSGEEIFPYEGKSLIPVFEGRGREGHDALFWEFSKARAVRQGKWKLVQDGAGLWELYDLERDRIEQHNLAEKHTERVAAMAASWEAWRKRVNTPTIRQPDPEEWIVTGEKP